MKRFRKFLNDLREPLGIGMKRLMIALTIILGIVIVTVAGWLLEAPSTRPTATVRIR